ncbi:MAG: DUF3500 domain-containing protein [Burkholderiales bacterium]
MKHKHGDHEHDHDHEHTGDGHSHQGHLKSFHDFIPAPTVPRIAGMLGKNAHEHGKAGLANPMARELLFNTWEKHYAEDFKGMTTGGVVLPGLYSLGPNGAPSEAMVAATLKLLALCTAEQKAALCFPLGAREWRSWNNTEMYIYIYGLRLEEVSINLRDAMMHVVRESLSAKGYSKIRDVMKLNHYLGELVGNTMVFGEWSFNFTLFGEPSTTAPWGWQLMGHHLALNCLVINGQMVLSPVFMGAEPNYADTGQFAGIRIFQDEEHVGLDLMRMLSSEQRAQAIIRHSNLGPDQPPGRWHRADQLHLGGAFHDNRVVPYEGVNVAGFSAAQKKRLMDLVNAYVMPLPEGPRKARMDEVESHLGDTFFCWIGGTGDESTFYYRIQSPVVFIEFDQHAGVYLTNPTPEKFHIHTIVRTPNGNDYGMDLLRMHYSQSHKGQKPGES